MLTLITTIVDDHTTVVFELDRQARAVRVKVWILQFEHVFVMKNAS